LENQGLVHTIRPRRALPTNSPLNATWIQSNNLVTSTQFCWSCERRITLWLASSVCIELTPKHIRGKGSPTSKQTIDTVEHHIVTLCGYPRSIVSDRGAQFVANVRHEHWEPRGVSVDKSSSYHPQTDGQPKHTIQTMTQYIRATLLKMIGPASFRLLKAFTSQAVNLLPLCHHSKLCKVFHPRSDTKLPFDKSPLPALEQPPPFPRTKLDAFLQTKLADAKHSTRSVMFRSSTAGPPRTPAQAPPRKIPGWLRWQSVPLVTGRSGVRFTSWACTVLSRVQSFAFGD